MKLNEATTPYKPMNPEIGIMTRSEFLHYRNPEDKFHNSDSYQTTIMDMNRSYFHQIYRSNWGTYSSPDEIMIDENSHGKRYFVNGKLQAVMINDVLFHLPQFPKMYKSIKHGHYYSLGKDFELVPSQTKVVKYLAPYIEKIDSISRKNIQSYPAVINRFILDNEVMEIRTTKVPYEKNSGESIVILNSEGYLISRASDEWGATLLQVADEYRGKTLGVKIGKIWYENNPSYLSGGFTSHGHKNSIKIWEDRVRTLLMNGWYSSLIKTGEVSYDKVKEIVGSISRKRPEAKPSELKSSSGKTLIYKDTSQVIVYDSRYLDNPDEKMVFGHIVFGDNSKYGLYPYKIDYDQKYKKLVTVIMLQVARDENQWLDIENSSGVDMVELDDIPDITIKKGKVFMTKGKIPNLENLSRYEKTLRSSKDQYDELYYQLLEDANSKWKD